MHCTCNPAIKCRSHVLPSLGTNATFSFVVGVSFTALADAQVTRPSSFSLTIGFVSHSLRKDYHVLHGSVCSGTPKWSRLHHAQPTDARRFRLGVSHCCIHIVSKVPAVRKLVRAKRLELAKQGGALLFRNSLNNEILICEAPVLQPLRGNSAAFSRMQLGIWWVQAILDTLVHLASDETVRGGCWASAHCCSSAYAGWTIGFQPLPPF